MISDVAALYVDPRGHYPKIVEHWYDEARDARTYCGPWPVVAHPPCGPWGRLKHLHRKPDEKPLAPHAIQQVRLWGGVLEHPAGSGLWAACNLPRPGARDSWGQTYEVEQVAWGHVARKRTWLYVVGVAPGYVAYTTRTGGTPTHWVSGFHSKTRNVDAAPPGIKICSAQQRRRTPPAFAAWLVDLAQAVRR